MHQLKIIDKDYRDILLPLETLGLRSKLRKRNSRSLIDIHRSLHKFPDTSLKDYPLLRRHLHLALQFIRRYSRFRGNKTVGKLHARHLQ